MVSDASRFISQEQEILNKLGISAQKNTIQERATLAKYVEEIDCALFKEDILLFACKEEIVTPNNIDAYIQDLLKQCEEIYDMALTMSPCWCFDKIAAFFSDMEKIVNFGDSLFKERFVLLLKLVTFAQEQFDMCSIADLFLGEIPSVIRSFKYQAVVNNN